MVGWYIDGESAEGGDEGGDSEDGFACPALKRLLTDAQSPDDRCFDTVLLYKMSKLSRQIAEALVIKRKLGASGVTVVSMTEPTSAERLFEGIMQVVDDFSREAGMMGGEITEAAPRRRRNDWLGFCQARTAARLWKVEDEPQDERANPSAWRPAWERVRGFSRCQRHHHRRRLSGRPWILSLVPRPGPRSRRR